MKLQRFIIVGLSVILTVQLGACYEATLEKIGAFGGGAAANKLAEHTGAARPFFIGVGAIIGAELGKRLGKYLDEQDRQKLQQQMNVQVQYPQPQVSVACTGEQGTYRNMSMQQARSMNCGNENKVVLSSSATVNVAGQECKNMKTEVMNTQGILETVNTQNCRGSDGEWHGKVV